MGVSVQRMTATSYTPLCGGPGASVEGISSQLGPSPIGAGRTSHRRGRRGAGGKRRGPCLSARRPPRTTLVDVAAADEQRPTDRPSAAKTHATHAMPAHADRQKRTAKDAGRQTDRQTERETDTQTDTQTDRDRHTDRQTDRQADRHTHETTPGQA